MTPLAIQILGLQLLWTAYEACQVIVHELRLAHTDPGQLCEGCRTDREHGSPYYQAGPFATACFLVMVLSWWPLARFVRFTDAVGLTEPSPDHDGPCVLDERNRAAL